LSVIMPCVLTSRCQVLYLMSFVTTCASTSAIHVARDLILGSQRSKLNNVTVNYSSRIQNNFLYVSQPRHDSHIISCNGENHIRYKPYHSSQYYNSVRHLSNSGIDPRAEAQVPMQFSGIFKIMSESAPVKVAQDFF